MNTLLSLESGKSHSNIIRSKYLDYGWSILTYAVFASCIMYNFLFSLSLWIKLWIKYCLPPVLQLKHDENQPPSDVPNCIQIHFQEALAFFSHTNSTLQVLEIKSKALHHSKTPELSLYHAGSYLQVRSLQSTVHVLFPRVWQLSLLWTGHVVHTSRSNTSLGVEEVRTD